MARHQRSFRGSPSRATRLTKTWFRTFIDDAPVTTTQSLVASVTVAEGVQMQTVMRTRGNLLVTAVPDSAADSGVLALGICVVRETAAAVGGLSLPGPIVDEGADFWLWHRYVGLADPAASAASGDSIGLNVRVEIDSKAMRKVQADSRVVLMAEMGQGEFTTVNLHGGIAFLLGC